MLVFFNDTATTEIYTLSLHDALPIYGPGLERRPPARPGALRAPCRHLHARGHLGGRGGEAPAPQGRDRKSTRLNSSHANISYAVFCLKKKQICPHYIVTPCLPSPCRS